MKGVWLENRHVRYREDLPLPSKEKPTDVYVRVLRAGICNTDLELIKGYYPFTGIIGHEFVGRVEDDKACERVRGKLVVGEINVVCDTCSFCKQGLRTHCLERSVLGIVKRWGAMAEYIVLPEENLHVVPDGISVEEACFLEPLAAAVQVSTQVAFEAGDRVAVIGDGKLGILVSQVVALTGCDLTAFGHHEEKLLILSNRGVKTSTSFSDDLLSKFDKVIECTGRKEVLKTAISLVRPRGTLIMKSTHHGDAEVDTAKIVVNELTLVGSRCGPMDKAIEILKDRKVDVLSLLSCEYPLADCLKALQHSMLNGALKIHLLC